MINQRLFMMVILYLSLVTTYTNHVWAEPNLPTFARIKLSRTKLRLEFQWSEARPPNFDPGMAVEFQVQIDPKCFAQPIGGKDKNIVLTKQYPNNFTVGKPYIDIWNYWVPSNYKDAKEQIKDSCGELNWFQESYISTLWKDFSDKQANFAIGVKNASELNNDFRRKEYYYFEYPLEIPMSDECLKSEQPGSGGTSVSMQYFPNTCTLFGGTKTFVCPELIGFFLCGGSGGKTDFWQQRICAPTETFSFIPGNILGLDWKKTSCWDNDHDGYFATQSFPMFGTNVGDCNDRDSKIKNERYNKATGQCVAEVITPCTGKKTGFYCASTLVGYTGNLNDLVHCQNNIVRGGESCKNGCKVNPPDIDDECKPSPSPCVPNCTPPQVCSTNGCVNRCGGRNEFCCEPGKTCEIPGVDQVVCDYHYNYTCRPCGSTWESCCLGTDPCNRITSGIGIFCDIPTNSCHPCGGKTMQCCKVGAPCEAGSMCYFAMGTSDYRCLEMPDP